MRATPPLFVLIWHDYSDGSYRTDVFVDLDDACVAFDEASLDVECIAAASVFQVVVQNRGVRRVERRWTPFEIDTEYRRWLQDKKDTANEKDRTRMQVRRAQMP